MLKVCWYCAHHYTFFYISLHLLSILCHFIFFFFLLFLFFSTPSLLTPSSNTLSLTVHGARDLPEGDFTGAPPALYVKTYVMPDVKKLTKVRIYYNEEWKNEEWRVNESWILNECWSCIVLYIVLYCIMNIDDVLYCIVLYCILYFIVSCIVLYCIVLYCVLCMVIDDVLWCMCIVSCIV